MYTPGVALWKHTRSGVVLFSVCWVVDPTPLGLARSNSRALFACATDPQICSWGPVA